MTLSLSEWESFYVITGSSGAALTGLMFVVIALAAERMSGTPSDGLGAYSTPTVVHFSAALMVASVMSMPIHSALTLSVAVALCAVAGLYFVISGARRMRRLEGYVAVAEDWIWHVFMPILAYASLLAAALMLRLEDERALIVIAAVELLLLFSGIRNAWDVAIYIVAQPAPVPHGKESAAVVAAPSQGTMAATTSPVSPPHAVVSESPPPQRAD